MRQVTIVTDKDGGEAIYLDGDLIYEVSTIFTGDLQAAGIEGQIDLKFVEVVLPDDSVFDGFLADDEKTFPDTLDELKEHIVS